MVIQRWQSVLLFLAAVMMAVFCFTPIAVYPDVDGAVEVVTPQAAPVLLILSAAIALLLFISIFMYRNLTNQLRVARLSVLLICADIVSSIFVAVQAFPGARVAVCGVSLLALAAIVVIFATRLIVSDRRKLRSYDRLR